MQQDMNDRQCGSVAFYDIWSGNGLGLSLIPACLSEAVYR